MQIELELYLRKLKELQSELADARLAKPSERTEFGYGVACGEYQGLKRAEQLLTSVIEEVADDREA